MAGTYALNAPLKEQFLRKLARFTSERDAEHAWRTACFQAGVNHDATLTTQSLMQVVERMACTDGVVGTVARSFQLRVLSHALLQEQARVVPTEDPVLPEVIDDPARMRELARIDLGKALRDDRLETLAKEAAAALSLPIAAVSIVLDGAQYFVALHGVDGWMAEARGTPVEWAFCTHAVNTRAPFVVPDAQQHPLVQGNPLVSNDGIRCYLGVPLVTPTGHALGTLCVIGTEPREFTDSDVEHIARLAEQVATRLEELGHGSRF
jgi:GAF domain-containing protein